MLLINRLQVFNTSLRVLLHAIDVNDAPDNTESREIADETDGEA